MKENHPKIKFGKTGVLLINLGTPDSTNWFDIKKISKRIFIRQESYRSQPYYLADNIKFIYSYVQTI